MIIRHPIQSQTISLITKAYLTLATILLSPSQLQVTASDGVSSHSLLLRVLFPNGMLKIWKISVQPRHGLTY